MITYTSDGGRIYECDICHESIGYCGPGDDEHFLEDLITVKGHMKIQDAHVHEKCMEKVIEEAKKVGERMKNERKRN